MNDIDPAPDGESVEDDLTAYSVDDETQLEPEDTLDGSGRGDDDVLDPGIVADDRPRGVDAWGTTAFEQEHRETIDQRLPQESPDDGGAYGRPTDHVREDTGAPDEELGRGADPRAGRLVAPDEGTHEDREAALVGDDVGIDGGAASAEEAAVHVDGEDPDDDLAAQLAVEERELAQEAGRLGITARDVEDFDGAGDSDELDESDGDGRDRG